MKFLDPHAPFFDKALTRWLTVLLPLAWSVVEFTAMAAPLWGFAFLAAGLYAGWMLLIQRPRTLSKRHEEGGPADS